jgi:hypothetical protein
MKKKLTTNQGLKDLIVEFKERKKRSRVRQALHNEVIAKKTNPTSPSAIGAIRRLNFFQQRCLSIKGHLRGSRIRESQLNHILDQSIHEIVSPYNLPGCILPIAFVLEIERADEPIRVFNSRDAEITGMKVSRLSGHEACHS